MTANVLVGRRLQKQDTRPSGNPAPAFNNEHPRLGSGRWHGAGPRGPRGVVSQASAPLPALPSPPEQPRHRVAHGQDHDGREEQALPTPRSHRPPQEASPVTVRSRFAGASPRVIRAGVLCHGR